MLKIYYICNEAVSCTVIAHTKEDALEEANYQLFEDDLEGVEIKALPDDKKVTINFEGNKITHTAADWCDIYQGFIKHAVMLGSSEG